MSVCDPINPRMIARAGNLNPKSFPIGSVVYFLRNKKHSSEKEIYYGTVIEHYASEIAIQLYEMIDVREIDGIPVKEFDTPTEWRKLPKGWTWDTTLFEVEWKMTKFQRNYEMDLRKPDDILKAINDGILVKVSENDHASFRSEVDSKLGWRIVREYSEDWMTDYTCEPFYQCYATWEEAQAELDAILEENQRQASLTDYEWSVEQMDEKLNRWAYIYSIAPEAKKQVRDRLLALDNFEDVCLRISGGGLEWKYDRNKRWIRIEV